MPYMTEFLRIYKWGIDIAIKAIFAFQTSWKKGHYFNPKKADQWIGKKNMRKNWFH